jgi:hypothetical protein
MEQTLSPPPPPPDELGADVGMLELAPDELDDAPAVELGAALLLPPSLLALALLLEPLSCAAARPTLDSRRAERSGRKRMVWLEAGEVRVRKVEGRLRLGVSPPAGSLTRRLGQGQASGRQAACDRSVACSGSMMRPAADARTRHGDLAAPPGAFASCRRGTCSRAALLLVSLHSAAVSHVLHAEQ